MRSPEGGLAPAVLFRPQLLTGSQISDRFRSRDCAVEKWDWQDVKAEEGSRPRLFALRAHCGDKPTFRTERMDGGTPAVPRIANDPTLA